MQPLLLLLKAYIVKMSNVSFKNKKKTGGIGAWMGPSGTIFSQHYTVCLQEQKSTTGWFSDVMYVIGV